MNLSRLSQFCDHGLEAGWLLAVTITPVFFNVYSSRVFEPDKLTTLRALSTVMAVLWLTRFMDEHLRSGQPLRQQSAVRFSLRTPMVLPALVTMVVYLVATASSLVSYVSLLGSYQRLQGTFTLFGYLVLFFSILTSLRTRLQLSRLITVLILNSLPISLYGIIQHSGLDPLPWAGDVTTRVASNMGNAIFVAAYLIMIVPLTASRIVESFGDILTREVSRVTDVLRASSYIFILAVQLLTIWHSQSRGPWLGIVALGFFFPFLALVVLQRQAQESADGAGGWVTQFLKGLGFGLVSLALAGGVAGGALVLLRGQLAVYVALGLSALAFGGLWLHFIVERRGWSWLWIGWGSVGLFIALILVLINVPGRLQTSVRQISALQRLTTITELQSGTGKVRGLIWQGTVDLIIPHEPIVFPDGSTDRLNPLRLLLGYGPESMYVAYNAFYPPELGHYESRTASPDRSHNETLDSLVITGVLGLAAYLFTFVSFFAWGFHWLGLLASRKQLLVYLSLDLLFALVFFIIAWRLEGAYLFAVAIPLGILVGTMVYLTLQGFRGLVAPVSAAPIGEGARKKGDLHPHSVLLFGLLAGAIAHFLEINFGIAIAATRTTFWVFAGLLVVLGLGWVPGNAAEPLSEGDQPELVKGKSQRSSRRVSVQRRDAAFAPWMAAVVALSLASTFLLGTLAFDFVNNPDRLTNAQDILIRSLTSKLYPQPTRAYGALMLFVFTWALFGVVGLSEFEREGLFDQQRRHRWTIALGAYAGISLMGGLIFGHLIAGHQAALTRIQVTSLEQVVDVADALSGLLGYYYGLIFVVLGVMGWVLTREGLQARASGSGVGFATLGVLLLVSVIVIRNGSYNLIRADIIFKQGTGFANSNSVNEKQVGIQHFERAIEYAPREDYYYLFLGKAYLELAQGLPAETTTEQREALLLRTEGVLSEAREINPLNTDHSANLARFYKSWAARVAIDLRSEDLDVDAISRLEDKRTQLLAQSLQNYEIALTLSPNNPILWNELAQLYAVDFGDLGKFEEVIAHSLKVDDAFEQTWMLIGDLSSSQGDITGAISAYQRSLEIRESCTVRRVVGTLFAQESRWDESTRTLEEAIDACPTSGELWEMYRVLAIAYVNQDQIVAALESAETALRLAPADQQPAIQQLVDQISGAQLLPDAPLAPEAP
jgi:tetratricopeptide (TPR) repeat protein